MTDTNLTTIGGLRDALSHLDPKAKVFIDGTAPSALSSYRGYYDNLAIERDPSTKYTATRIDKRGELVTGSYRGTYTPGHIEVQIKANATVRDLLKALNLAIGKEFEGYKGGQFLMDAFTPLWVSEHGQCDGLRIESIEVLDGQVNLSTHDTDW